GGVGGTRGRRVRRRRSAGVNSVADPVVLALRDPAAVASFSLQQWEVLILQARRANLLARIAVALDDLGLLNRVPAAPRAHLHAAQRLANAHAHPGGRA